MRPLWYWILITLEYLLSPIGSGATMVFVMPPFAILFFNISVFHHTYIMKLEYVMDSRKRETYIIHVFHHLWRYLQTYHPQINRLLFLDHMPFYPYQVPLHIDIYHYLVYHYLVYLSFSFLLKSFSVASALPNGAATTLGSSRPWVRDDFQYQGFCRTLWTFLCVFFWHDKQGNRVPKTKCWVSPTFHVQLLSYSTILSSHLAPLIDIV